MSGVLASYHFLQVGVARKSGFEVGNAGYPDPGNLIRRFSWLFVAISDVTCRAVQIRAATHRPATMALPAFDFSVRLGMNCGRLSGVSQFTMLRLQLRPESCAGSRTSR